MTDTSINGLVNPQDFGTGVSDGDEDYISAGYHTIPKPPTACIINGLGFTPDFGVPDVDIAPGIVQVPDTGISVQSGSQTTYDTTVPNEALQHVIIPNTVTIPLDDGVVNELWIGINQSNQDDVFIRHGSGLSEPTEPSVKIGEVDTSGDTISEQWGLVAGDNVLTYPSVSVAENERSSLPDGTVVYARDTSEHIVSGIDVATVSADELNSGDISDTQAANLIPVTDGNGNLQIISVPNAALSNDSVTVAGNNVSLGGSTTPDAADLAGSLGDAGQFLTTDGSDAAWQSISSSVAASETDDASDITEYVADVFNGDVTLLDITGSGIFLGAYALGESPRGFQITVDGGTSFTTNWEDVAGASLALSRAPAIKFESSLKVVLTTFEGGTAFGLVKQ